MIAARGYHFALLGKDLGYHYTSSKTTRHKRKTRLALLTRATKVRVIGDRRQTEKALFASLRPFTRPNEYTLIVTLKGSNITLDLRGVLSEFLFNPTDYFSFHRNRVDSVYIY